jgi:hypothetical protein
VILHYIHCKTTATRRLLLALFYFVLLYPTLLYSTFDFPYSTSILQGKNFIMTTPTTPDWQGEMQKWNQGINLLEATSEDIAKYIAFKLWKYNKNKVIDNLL